ncbi:MAG TPA: hypothetical protein VIX86_17660 [Streptosporangiaceae bacterium]
MDPLGDAAEVAGKAAEVADEADDLVPPAREPENTVLVDNAQSVRWAGPAFVLFSLLLLPWTIYLSYTLPSHQVSADYDIAWVGFDVMLMLVLASTGYFALRRSRYLAPAAAAMATLLVVDAWFDVVTSPPGQRMLSIVLAVLIELPLAALCIWLSYHSEQLAERRIVLLLRRDRRGRARRPR